MEEKLLKLLREYNSIRPFLKQVIMISKANLLFGIFIVLIVIILVFSYSSNPMKSNRKTTRLEKVMIKKGIEAQEALKLGASDYNEAATLLAYYKETIDKNRDYYPNLETEEIFSVVCAIFMSEGSKKDKKTGCSIPGKSINYTQGYNGLGVKAGSSWEGDIIIANYWEVIDGKRFNFKGNIKDKANCFRSYMNLEEALNDWFIFTSADRYEDARNASTIDDCIKELVKGGYATDKTAIKRWQNIVKSNDFINIYNEN